MDNQNRTPNNNEIKAVNNEIIKEVIKNGY